MAWGEEETLTFPTSTGNVSKVNDGISVTGTDVSVSITKGSGSNLATNSDGSRVYTGNSIVFSSTTKKIAKIVFTYNRNKKQTNGITANVGSFTAEFTIGNSNASDLTAIWEASDQTTDNVTFTVGSGSGNYALKTAVVTYVDGGSTTEKVATPTFTPAAGVYTSAQSVEISSATDGATVYYTTDGTEPTASSSVYRSAISVSANTTIKAIAVKEGYDNSAIATATYTIVNLQHAGTEADPYTVADAIALLSADPAASYENVYVKGIISQIDSYNSKYSSITYWISDDGETTIQFEVYSGKGLNGADFSDKTDLTVGNTVVVKGTIKKYNTTYEFDINSEIVSMEEVTFPVINANEALQLAYDATSGSFEYFITNPVAGKSLNATTDANWISNVVVGDEAVTFTTTANEGNADRTATITLSYDGADDKTVTVTQKHFVADFATLPFEFNGGRGDIATTAGLTESGLGSDYNSAPKLKFDHAGDELVLKFNERPGKLSFDVKGNPGGDPSVWNAVFKVQTSTDGINYTDLASYDNLESTNTTKEFNTLDANVRYIKWVYTEKVSGNVALGNIKLDAYVAPQNFTLTIPETDNVTITAAYGEDQMLEEGQNAEIEQNTEIILTVDAAEGYDLKSLTVTGPDGQSFAPQAVADTEGAYKFTMPAYNATVNATVAVHVEPTGATYVLATAITSGKHYVIASGTTSGDVKVMGNQNTNNRAAEDATIGDDGKLNVSEEYEFVIESATIDEASGYSIFDASENGGYLYAASSSSNHLKTQSENSANGVWAITIDSEGKASVVAQGTNTRNVMQYNNGSNLFSCYGSASQAPVYLFEKVEDTPQPEAIEVTISAAGYSTLYYGTKNLTVPTDMEAYTVKVTTKVERSTTYKAGDVIPAGTGVVLKAAQGTYEFTEAAEAPAKDEANMLRGSDVKATTTGGTYYYALTLDKNKQNPGFYWMKENGAAYEAGAHKAYLALDKTFAELAGNGNAKSFLALPDNETDGIRQIENGQTAIDNAEIYNLSGQRVNKAQKGIYIVNGKKVVMK